MDIDSGKFMLQFTAASITHQFMALKDYYKEIAPMILSQKQEIIDKDDKLQKKLLTESDGIRDQYYDTYFDDFYIIEMVEHTFCNSMTISIYTLIEKYLNEICDSLKNYKNIPITYKELKDTGVIGAKKYMTKLCGLQFDTATAMFLSGINAVRNVIAHENGDLYSATQSNINKIINISKQTAGCKVKSTEGVNDKGEKTTVYQHMELGFEFVEYCFEKSQLVFETIFRQLP